MLKPRIKSLLIVVPLLAITVVFSVAMLAGGSAGGRLQSGRSVMTYSDSISLVTTCSFDTETIETAWPFPWGDKILVTPSALIVNGVTVANIDKNVADVQVRVKRGVVTFVADGTPVQTSVR